LTIPNGLTDMHNHILFGLDDGPNSLEESLHLLTAMKLQGVHRVICTSHYLSPYFSVSTAQMEESFEAVAQAVDAFPGSYPEVCLGAEIRVCDKLVDELRHGSLPVLGNTSYVLLEFPTNDVPPITTSLMYELVVHDYIPILAHPERNLEIQRDPSWLDRLTEAGVYLQLTAECFLPKDARQSRVDAFAWQILQDCKATLIASDAHNTTSRPPVLGDAYISIRERLGEDVIDHLAENADNIWTNQEISPVKVETSARHWSLPFFRPRRS